MTKLPNSSYWKFREPNDRTEEIFIDRAFWFSKPKYFNDPFDCQRSLSEIFRELDLPHEKQPIAGLIAHLFNKILLSDNGRDSYLCLCKNYEQTLMWSHYALSHSGIAIGIKSKTELFRARKYSCRGCKIQWRPNSGSREKTHLTCEK